MFANDRKNTFFLSVGEPHNQYQENYLNFLEKHLETFGLKLESLGRTFWSVRAPLKPIQQKMKDVFGAVILAMERLYVRDGIFKEGSKNEKRVNNIFLPTVWNQIEAAMAYQMGLPLLILKDEKLYAEGMIDPSIHEWQVIRIDIKNPDQIKFNPYKGMIASWVEEVKVYYYSCKNKTNQEKRLDF